MVWLTRENKEFHNKAVHVWSKKPVNTGGRWHTKGRHKIMSLTAAGHFHDYTVFRRLTGLSIKPGECIAVEEIKLKLAKGAK